MAVRRPRSIASCATRFGVAAVDLIAEGGDLAKWCVCTMNGTEAVSIADAIGQLKTVDPHGQIVNTARAIGISFGD